MGIYVNISNQFLQNIILIRRARGAYTNGIWNAGIEIKRCIRASVQPVQPSLYKILPEGTTPSRARQVFWSGCFENVENGGEQPDELLIKGINYRLNNILDWHENGYMSALFINTERNDL